VETVAETEIVQEPGTDTPVEIEATSNQLAAVEAERRWFRAVVKGFLLGAPIGALVFVGLVSLALVGQGVEIKGALVVAVVVGINGGLFFGPWAAVLKHSPALDEADERAAYHP
jgi:NO-binding membrane sensor protein with MHYT domain